MSTDPIPRRPEGRHLTVVEQTTTVYRSRAEGAYRDLARENLRLEWELAKLRAELELARLDAEQLLNADIQYHPAKIVAALYPSDEAVSRLAPHRREYRA